VEEPSNLEDYNSKGRPEIQKRLQTEFVTRRTSNHRARHRTSVDAKNNMATPKDIFLVDDHDRGFHTAKNNSRTKNSRGVSTSQERKLSKKHEHSMKRKNESSQ